jgi:hypothetical protein
MMIKMVLDAIQILNGTLSLIFVVISVIIGIMFLIKYQKYKNMIILLVGLVWLGIVSSWYASSTSFLVALFTGGTGYMEIPQVYFIIGITPLPITAYLWIVAFTNLLYQDKKKIIRIVFALIGIIFEIIFFTLLILSPSLVGVVTSPVDAEYDLLITIYQAFLVILVLTSGYLFAKESIKDESPEINLKGKFLLAAFFSFVIGSILEIISGFSILILVIARIILISSAIEFYMGFLLPERVKNFFLK